MTAADDTRTATNHAYLTIDTQFTKNTEGPPPRTWAARGSAPGGDFDGDGDPDLASCATQAARVPLPEQRRRHLHDPCRLSLGRLGRLKVGVFWGDFRQRRAPGPCQPVGENQPASIYFGDGHGTFTARQLQLGPSWSIAVADYDQDGFLDLYGSYSGHLLRNNGDRTFTRMTTQAACRLPHRPHVGGGAPGRITTTTAPGPVFFAPTLTIRARKLAPSPYNNGRGVLHRDLHPTHPAGARRCTERL
ncbi:MAG: VCBS repeat-containing protein [Verrucomicrobia bacterium]|nr:VCBS repeat-containing protein [Verrucomicrobiota bacterium]